MMRCSHALWCALVCCGADNWHCNSLTAQYIRCTSATSSVWRDQSRGAVTRPYESPQSSTYLSSHAILSSPSASFASSIYYIALCCVVLYCTVLLNVVLNCAPLYYNAILYCSILQYIVLHFTVMQYVAARYTVLCYAAFGACQASERRNTACQGRGHNRWEIAGIIRVRYFHSNVPIYRNKTVIM